MKQQDSGSVIKTEPLAVTIDDAARMVGLSRSQFYRLYLDGGRLKSVPKGRRRMIDVKELRSAYEQYVAEVRAHE